MIVNKIKSQKKKFLIAFLIILLILALTGCMVAPELTDRYLAEEAVTYYWQAIINRQYELAKCYCIIDGIWYNKVDEWEEYININSEGEASVVIYGPSFYEQSEAIGNNAVVYATIATDITAFPGSCIHEGGLFEYEIELIKTFPSGDWKLK